MSKKTLLIIVITLICILCNYSYAVDSANTESNQNPFLWPVNLLFPQSAMIDRNMGAAADFNVSMALCKPSKVTIGGTPIAVLNSPSGCQLKVGKGDNSILCSIGKETRLDLWLVKTTENNFQNCDSKKRELLMNKLNGNKQKIRDTIQSECKVYYDEDCKKISENKIQNYDGYAELIRKEKEIKESQVVVLEEIKDTTSNEYVELNNNYLEECKNEKFITGRTQNANTSVCFTKEGVKYKNVNEYRRDVNATYIYDTVEKPKQKTIGIKNFNDRCVLRSMARSNGRVYFDSEMNNIYIGNIVGTNSDNYTVSYRQYTWPLFKPFKPLFDFSNFTAIEIESKLGIKTSPDTLSDLTLGKKKITILRNYFNLGLLQSRQSDAIKINNDIFYKYGTRVENHAFKGSRYIVVLTETAYNNSANYTYIYDCK